MSHEGLWMPTNNGWKGPFQKRWLICHGTAGGASAQGIAEYFRSTEGTNNPVSSNYVIGRDGVIVSLLEEEDAAWANGDIEPGCDPWWVSLGKNPNLVTISIEFCKETTDNSQALSLQQMQSGFNLIERICKRHNIPMRPADSQGGITGHYSISPRSRARCPGNFPWTDLYRFLNNQGADMLSLTDPHVAALFAQAPGNAWKCLDPKHQYVVGNAMLDFYRSLPCGGSAPLGALDILGLPTSGEMELSATLPGAIVQYFQTCALVYHPGEQPQVRIGMVRP